MKILIENEATLTDMPKELHEKIKETLTITNPMFAKKIGMGLSVWGVPQYVKYYSKTGNDFKVPIGALGKILDLVISGGVAEETISMVDKRITKSNKDFFDKIIFHPEMRGFQKDIVAAMMSRSVGTIKAKTGSGKTLSFIKYIIQRGENTLILVNTKELSNQTIDALINYTSLEKSDIGFIGSGKFSLKPVTLGILQTFNAYLKNEDPRLKDIADYFGQVIVDETHIIPAMTYYKVISHLPCKYKFGFSATPFREDGLTDVIHFGVGPIIHEVPEGESNNFLIIPDYVECFTDYDYLYVDSGEYQLMISELSEDKDRSDFILEKFKEVGEDIPSCFICSRTSQVEYLHSKIKNSVMLTSKMTKKAREEAMTKLRSKQAIHVISTYGLFSTGIDIPFLENLYLCAPIKSLVKLKQTAGRLMRKSLGKVKATIYDFIDRKIGILAGQARKRKKILTNL